MTNLSRRKFVRTTLAAGAGSALLSNKITAGSYADEIPASLENKKVLYVEGGWDGHEPQQSVDVFVPWLKSQGAKVVVSDTLDSYLDEELMSSLDLII